MLEPGKGVAYQRLAQPKMIEAGQPIGLCKELVEAVIGRHAPGNIVVATLQLDPGIFVLLQVPLSLEILLEKIAVADLARLDRQTIVAHEQLAMFPEEPVSVLCFGHNAPPPTAEVVPARVVKTPKIGQPGGLARNVEEAVALI